MCVAVKISVCFTCILFGVIVAYLLSTNTDGSNLSSGIIVEKEIVCNKKEDSVNIVSATSLVGILLKICAANFFVAFVVSVLGFATGGLITCVILFANAFNMTLLIKNAILANSTALDVIHSTIFHGIFEVPALIWFGCIGLSGFSFYKRILSDQPFNINWLPHFKIFIIPSIMLFVAAIIETLYGWSVGLI